MSIQLIVYPQYYDGSYNPISGATSQFIVDGINFTTINSSASGTSLPYPAYSTAITNMLTIPVNTWYRFSGGAGEVTQSTGAITIGNGQGVGQQLSNLSIGENYDCAINVSTYVTSSSQTLHLRHYHGTTLRGVWDFSGTGVTTISFQAYSSRDTLLLWSSANSNVIESISVTPSGIQPSGNTTFLGTDGQVICDLYEDEDIPLTLSVDEFKNVAEKVQSYSKAFNLPGTKRNNQIFDNLFEITRADDGIIFNPYKKTKCVLKQDGFMLFEGYLKMQDIQEKEGEVSYNVNLYSEVIALADLLKDRKFNQLDFKELTHDYQKTNIKNSWNDSGTGIAYTNSNTSGFRDDYSTLKYPFVDWTGQVIIADNPGGSSGATDNYPELPNLETVFRPFIQLKYLINRIFADTPFTWESNFFDSTDFGKLYMDFSWGGNETPVPENEYYATWNYVDPGGAAANPGTGSFTEFRLIPEGVTGGQSGSTLPPNYNTGTYIITATNDNERYAIDYRFKVKNTNFSVGKDAEFQWVIVKGGVTQHINYESWTIGAGNSYNYSGTLLETLNTGDTLKAQFNAPSDVIQNQGLFDFSYATFTVSNLSITSAILNTLRGDLGQWNFLKGIMNMFNLVSIPDEGNPNHIKIEPYNDIFLENSDSKQWNWTDKIDVEEMKLIPLTELNKNTDFNFVEDDDDYVFNVYKKHTGKAYGSKEFDGSAIASNGLATILQGTMEISADPFAATLSGEIMPQYSGIVIPKVYKRTEDLTEGFDNSPRILYNNGVKDSGITYYIPAQNGLSSENQPDYLQFSHLTDVPTIVSTPTVSTDTIDFHFGQCQLVNSLGLPTPRNLFNLYWLPYYAELYHPDTRIMTIKVNLSPSIINTFKFYDTVIIKNREFRVNKIDYKPNDLAIIEFILIP